MCKLHKKVYKSDILFPSTNMRIGAGSVFNLAGNYYKFNYSKSPELADAKAIENDWGLVGQNIKEIIEAYPVSKAHLLCEKYV